MILVTLMMEEISSSEMSVLIRATQRNSPENAILQFIKMFILPESSGVTKNVK
jgi:hypothetical protein